MSNSLQSKPLLRSLVVPTLFLELERASRERLLSHSPRRTFEDDQIIDQRGDDPNGFWVIERGVVKIGQFGLNGEFRAIALLSDGDSFGELALFAANRRAVDAIAYGEAQLRWIAAESFEREIQADPATMRRLIGNLAAQLQETLGLVVGLGQSSSLSRVAALLSNMAPKSQGPVSIQLNQQELGELTGLTRATVNKCLSELEARGALRRHYRKVEILDHTVLENILAD